MKYKKAIIFSTIMIFVVAAVVALGWLFRVRYFIVNDLNGSASDTAASELYEFVNDTLEENYKGKWIFSFSENQIVEKLTANPYIELIEVKKSSPDKVIVTFSERKERFVILSGNKGYITDFRYNLLCEKDDLSETSLDGLVKVEISGMEGYDFSNLPKGKKIEFKEENLFGAMTDIFENFTDKFNFIAGISLDGVRNKVQFFTKTGVIIDVSLSVATTDKPTEAEKKETKERICQNVAEIERLFDSLDVKSKRSGYIRVYETTDESVKVNYEPNVEELGEGDDA